MNDIKYNAALCIKCGELMDITDVEGDEYQCPHCGSLVRQRKKNSLSRTWALTIGAIIFYIPANFLPMMNIEVLGDTSYNTLLGGIMKFIHSGQYFIGAIVFIASFIVPLFKIFSIIYLLLSVHYDFKLSLKYKTKLFHFVEFIGKWSMLDVYVIAVMAGLVSSDYFLKISGGLGVVFFTAVVVLTMMASSSFDTRLIWDNRGAKK